jgi:FlaA1/EpsC-like NDP-sugar epimerase
VNLLRLRDQRTSARFANVAFSNGSLLESFEVRLRRGQLLACPREIKRYFVTLAESGAICALAALLVENANIALVHGNGGVLSSQVTALFGSERAL